MNYQTFTETINHNEINYLQVQEMWYVIIGMLLKEMKFNALKWYYIMKYNNAMKLYIK